MKDRKWSQTQLIRKYRTMRSDIYARLRAFYQKPQGERGQGTYADILADIKTYNDRVMERDLHQLEGVSVITRQSIRTALGARR